MAIPVSIADAGRRIFRPDRMSPQAAVGPESDAPVSMGKYVAEETPAAPKAPSKTLKADVGDIAGGLASAGVNFALAISLGLLAFMPLGPRYYEIGIYAGFASAIYGQFIAGIFGGAAHPGSGPRAATTLILAALVAALAADPALAPSATQGPEWIVAIAAATVVLAGVIQVVLGTLGAGSSARFVPYPFVAGFMCGASALIIVAQIAPLAGVSPAVLASGPAAVWNAMEPATFLVGLATALFIWIVGTKWKRWPAPLIGLVAGSLLYHAIAFVFRRFAWAQSSALRPACCRSRRRSRRLLTPRGPRSKSIFG